MNIIEDLLIPYVGPGCCHNKNCQFYWYEFYHMPTKSCPDWEPLQKELISDQKYSSKFNLHEFIDYVAHKIKWRCVESSCALWPTSGMHSKELQGCISHETFCNHFNIKFEKIVPSSHHHMPDLRKAAEPKNKPKSVISDHKISYQTSAKLNISENNWDDLPPLGEDSGESDSDCDSDCGYQTEIGESFYQGTADMKMNAYGRNEVLQSSCARGDQENSVHRSNPEKFHDAVNVVEKMETTSVS